MKNKLIVIILGFFPLFAVAATGQTVASVANSVTGHLPSVSTLMVSLSYIFGIIFGFKSLLKFKEHNETKGQVKLVIPIVMFVASGLFLALPSVIKIGKETVGFTSSSSGGNADPAN